MCSWTAASRNTRSMPCIAARAGVRCAKSPSNSSTSGGSTAAADLLSRTKARTRAPRASVCFSTSSPFVPVAPVTSTVMIHLSASDSRGRSPPAGLPAWATCLTRLHPTGLRRRVNAATAREWPPASVGSPVVGVLRDGSADGRRYERERAALDPRALARCEARRQHAVVDLARDGEAVELRRGDEEAVLRQAAVGEVRWVGLPRPEKPRGVPVRPPELPI